MAVCKTGMRRAQVRSVGYLNERRSGCTELIQTPVAGLSSAPPKKSTNHIVTMINQKLALKPNSGTISPPAAPETCMRDRELFCAGQPGSPGQPGSCFIRRRRVKVGAPKAVGNDIMTAPSPKKQHVLRRRQCVSDGHCRVAALPSFYDWQDDKHDDGHGQGGDEGTPRTTSKRREAHRSVSRAALPVSHL